jgi:hypothetical protein
VHQKYRRRLVTAYNQSISSSGHDANVWTFIHETLNLLTADGMSSEESEPEQHTIHRHIMYRKKMPWRRDMDTLLDVVDAHRIQGGSGFHRSGCEPAMRLPSNDQRTTRAPRPGLPRVLYNPEWLDQLGHEYIRVILKPNDTIQYNWMDVMPYNMHSR